MSAKPEPKAPVESVIDTLFTGLVTCTELARGVLQGRPQEQLTHAAMVAGLYMQVAYGALYEVLEDDDLPAVIRAELERAMQLEPGKSDEAKAEAAIAKEWLERLRAGTASVVAVDLSKTKGVKA